MDVKKKRPLVEITTPYAVPHYLNSVLVTATGLEPTTSIAKNRYDHLKYLKVNDSSDSKFNCNLDILIGAYYHWDFVSGNIRRENSGSVAVKHIRLGP